MPIAVQRIYIVSLTCGHDFVLKSYRKYKPQPGDGMWCYSHRKFTNVVRVREEMDETHYAWNDYSGDIVRRNLGIR